MGQYEDWGGGRHDSKGRIYGGSYQGGKNQKDDEGGGSTCPCCDGEEYFLISIRGWTDDREMITDYIPLSCSKEEVDQGGEIEFTASPQKVKVNC